MDRTNDDMDDFLPHRSADATRARRNYAKAVKGFTVEALEFFDDTLESAKPILDALKDIRTGDGKIVLSMYRRSHDPELEAYRQRARIGIVGESNPEPDVFKRKAGIDLATLRPREEHPLPGMREDALR